MNKPFNINILSPGKKKKKYSISHTILLFLLPLFTWIIVAGGLYLFLYSPTCKKRQNQQQHLQKFKQEQTHLTDLRRKLEKQKTMYFLTSGEGIDWSSKLMLFSVMVPKDLWISKLIFAKDEKSKDKSYLLDIDGQTISTSHKESLDKIALFIEKINRAPSFYKEFSPLEFNYSQLLDEKNRIMDFKLSSRSKFVKEGDEH